MAALPESPLISAMAQTAGRAWIEGCPLAKRLPSSISRKVPAVPFRNAAAADTAVLPVPITEASPTGLTVSLAVSACISGSAAPPTMAPIVSRMT